MSSGKLLAPIASTFLLWLDGCLLCLPSKVDLALRQVGNVDEEGHNHCSELLYPSATMGSSAVRLSCKD